MGFSAIAIADRVGHESIDITYNYAHLFPSRQAEMTTRLDIERTKTVAFRMSPEENAQLDTAVRMCGLTKQDYIIQKLLNHDVIVKGNARVFKALRSLLGEVLTELKRIEAGTGINLELMEIIRMMTDILSGMEKMKGEEQ